MLTVLAFIVTIVVIVAFHEWGHFLAMRAFGIRVLTFSVGFGPRIARFTDKKGTDWVISAIPLGGFVKPLDRRDSEMPPDANICLLYTSPSPRDATLSRMPSSA